MRSFRFWILGPCWGACRKFLGLSSYPALQSPCPAQLRPLPSPNPAAAHTLLGPATARVPPKPGPAPADAQILPDSHPTPASPAHPCSSTPVCTGLQARSKVPAWAGEFKGGQKRAHLREMRQSSAALPPRTPIPA